VLQLTQQHANSFKTRNADRSYIILPIVVLPVVGGAYQEIDSAAHAVVAAVVTHHCAVVKETHQESLHQGDEVLDLWPQQGTCHSTLQQTDTHTHTNAHRHVRK
jgi:hypothetical protein